MDFIIRSGFKGLYSIKPLDTVTPFQQSRDIASSDPEVDLLLVEVDRRGIQLRNALVNTRLLLVHRVDPDRAKKGARHLKEGAFTQIEPRPPYLRK